MLGLARSLLLYYAIPGRARAWRHFYAQFVRPSDLCIDAGAHVGSRSRALLACGARVLALEPQPLLFRTLQRLLGQHPNLTLDPRALGALPGAAAMLVSRRTPTVSTLSEDWSNQVAETEGFDWVRWEGRQPVHVTTLDRLIAEHGLPAFCKLDIEGYEAQALAGLSQPIPMLSFEYVPAAMQVALECVDRLEQISPYQYNLIRSEYPQLAYQVWLDAGAVRAELGAMPASARAGEVYARRVT